MRRALRTLVIAIISLPIGLAVSLCNADVAVYLVSRLAAVTTMVSNASGDSTISNNVNTGRLVIGGGTSPGNTSTGAYIEIDGNSSPSTGNLFYSSGSTAGSFIGHELGSSTSYIRFRDSAFAEILRINSAGNILYGQTNGRLLSNTTDGSDTSNIFFGAGSVIGSARSGYFGTYGNEASGGNGGLIQMYSGDAASGHVEIGTTNASAQVRLLNPSGIIWSTDSSGNLNGNATNGGDVILQRSGRTIRVDSGTAASACAGTGTHNGTTAVTISTTCAATGMRVFFTDSSEPTTFSGCWVNNIVNGTSFDVDCKLAGQDATFNWWITKEG